MGLKHLDDYENPENAKEQFDIIVANCRYMLGRGDDYKDVLDLPEELKDRFNMSLQTMEDRGMLALIAILQKSITSAYLLLEEGYDFTQHKGDLNNILEAVKNRSNQEDSKEESFELFANAKEVVRSGGVEPPHEDMIRAKDYFNALAQEKLEAELTLICDKFKVEHGTIYLNKDNHKQSTTHWEEEGEISGIKVRKNISRIQGRNILQAIEILEGDYAGEQLFSFDGAISATKWKNDLRLPMPYAEANKDLFQSAINKGTKIFPGHVESDAVGNLDFVNQGDTAKYWYKIDSGSRLGKGIPCLIVVNSGESGAETEVEVGVNVLASLRTIRR